MQNYYIPFLKKYQNDSRKTWQIMKEITGKLKAKNHSFTKDDQNYGQIHNI